MAESGVLTGAQLIKNAPGYVFTMEISWRDATVGQILCYLLDSTSDTSADQGTHEIPALMADTANGFRQFTWAQGKQFETGIFYKEGAVSDVNVSLQYK